MFRLPKFGQGVCLSRVSALLDRLHVDKARLSRSSVVITGSNGKGSTAIFCSHIGMAFGLKTGTFTSPHLFDFSERFRIDGVNIDKSLLSMLVNQVEGAIVQIEAELGRRVFGAFEAQFALAALFFQRQGTQFNVFEAGIGGRYDPTRLVEPKVSCVVSLDLEHTQLLGNTLELICYDKSDAAAAGGRIVYGESCVKLRSEIEQYNHLKHTTPFFVGGDVSYADVSENEEYLQFDLTGPFGRIESVRSRLHGSFQLNNAAVGTLAFWLWLTGGESAEAGGETVDRFRYSVRAGVEAAVWPGRLEKVLDEPLVIIDVGHTPDGISRALDGLFSLYGPDDWVLVTGVSVDKKAEDILRLLKPKFSRVVCTAAHHKGAPAEEIAAIMQRIPGRARVWACADIAAAMREAMEIAKTEKLRIYVAGGLFLGIEFTHALRGHDPGQLEFF